MKKLVFVSTTVLLAMTLSAAQVQAQAAKNEPKSEMKPLRTLESGKVSDQAKAQFDIEFGKLPNVEWRRSVNFDEATFTKDGQKVTAFFDYNAKLVGTTSVKAFTDLPVNAQKDIKAKYKDYSVGPVIFFEDNETNDTDMVLYLTQFEDADNYFVELTKGNSKIILEASASGNVSFFKQL